MLLEDVFTSIMLFLPELVKGVVALVIIVDPFGNIPIFISLTKNMDEQQRSNTFRTAVLTGLILLFAFTVAGQ